MFETRISAYGTFVILVLLLTGSVTTGSAQSLYDNFKAPKISPDKWVGGEGASLLGLETTRAIENGQLRLRNRSVGFTASDSGFGTNFVFLGLPDPQAAGYMRATVTATNANEVGCSGNTTPTQSFVGLVGSFFNAGTPTNGDATDDVIAAVGISSDSDKIAASQSPEVVFYVLRCADQGCNTFTVLDSGSLRSIAVGTPALLQLFWNPLNHIFAFFYDEANRTFSHVSSYAGVVTDTSPPGLPFKHLQAQNNVANCTTVPRPVANVSALYDRVFLAPTCKLPQTECSGGDLCCDGGCNQGTCCANPTAPCSSDQDCCGAPGLTTCGGTGSPHCCKPTVGAFCNPADPKECCSGVCIPNPQEPDDIGSCG